MPASHLLCYSRRNHQCLSESSSHLGVRSINTNTRVSCMGTRCLVHDFKEMHCCIKCHSNPRLLQNTFFPCWHEHPFLGTYGWGGGDRKMLPLYNLFPFSAAKSKAKYEKGKGSPYFQKHNPPLGCLSGLKS